MLKTVSKLRVLTEVYTFAKSQLSAFLGGIVDFVAMVMVVEVFKLHYIVGIGIGGIIGAFANYQINKRWTFNVASKKNKDKFAKFIIVVFGSILLKSWGTDVLVIFFDLDYKIARIMTDVLVALGFNYSMQRLWVFRD